MKRAALLTILVLALLAAAPLHGQAAETPTAAVERLNATLLEVMQHAGELGYQGRYDRLAPVLEETFDFPAMAQVALASYWSSISDAQRQAFTQAFTNYSIGVFADRFDGYGGEKFEILGEKPAWRGTVMVENRIVKSDGEAVAINYVARADKDSGSWRLVDTVLGGVSSELANRRREYDSTMRTLGIEALIRSLQDKTATFAAD